MNDCFSDKLKKLRLSKNLTQDELAKMIYINRFIVVKWEQNRDFPNIEALQRISEIFDVSIYELLSEKKLKTIEVTNNKNIKLRRKIFLLSALTSILLIICIFFNINLSSKEYLEIC